MTNYRFGHKGHIVARPSNCWLGVEDCITCHSSKVEGATWYGGEKCRNSGCLDWVCAPDCPCGDGEGKKYFVSLVKKYDDTQADLCGMTFDTYDAALAEYSGIDLEKASRGVYAMRKAIYAEIGGSVEDELTSEELDRDGLK